MQVVIEMSDELYNMIRKFEKYAEPFYLDVTDCTPLPKNHGRLIDAGKLTDEILKYQDKCRPNKNEYEMALYQAYDYAIYEIEDATTIIEADREENIFRAAAKSKELGDYIRGLFEEVWEAHQKREEEKQSNGR